jgi:hypothetical protein
MPGGPAREIKFMDCSREVNNPHVYVLPEFKEAVIFWNPGYYV